MASYAASSCSADTAESMVSLGGAPAGVQGLGSRGGDKVGSSIGCRRERPREFTTTALGRRVENNSKDEVTILQCPGSRTKSMARTTPPSSGGSIEPVLPWNVVCANNQNARTSGVVKAPDLLASASKPDDLLSLALASAAVAGSRAFADPTMPATLASWRGRRRRLQVSFENDVVSVSSVTSVESTAEPHGMSHIACERREQDVTLPTTVAVPEVGAPSGSCCWAENEAVIADGLFQAMPTPRGRPRSLSPDDITTCDVSERYLQLDRSDVCRSNETLDESRFAKPTNVFVELPARRHASLDSPPKGSTFSQSRERGIITSIASGGSNRIDAAYGLKVPRSTLETSDIGIDSSAVESNARRSPEAVPDSSFLSFSEKLAHGIFPRTSAERLLAAPRPRAAWHYSPESTSTLATPMDTASLYTPIVEGGGLTRGCTSRCGDQPTVRMKENGWKL